MRGPKPTPADLRESVHELLDPIIEEISVAIIDAVEQIDKLDKEIVELKATLPKVQSEPLCSVCGKDMKDLVN